jgi:hypothetical protein
LDGEALALLLSGEGAMTFSCTVGPRLPSVSTYPTKECPVDLFALSLPMMVYREGTMSDNHVNQHPDPASEAHVALICIACTITL